MSSRAGYDTVPKPVSGSHPAANLWPGHTAADSGIEEQQLLVPNIACGIVGREIETPHAGPRTLIARIKLIRVVANTGVLADVVPYSALD